MPNIIKSKDEYLEVMEKIESYLIHATKKGGFHALSSNEREELQVLSNIAERWEELNVSLSDKP